MRSLTRPGRRPVVAALVVALALVGASCSSGSDEARSGAASAASTAAATPEGSLADGLCAATPVPGPAPTLAVADLVETSGVVASRTQPGVLWAHNDSGGGAEVFAVGVDGTDQGRVEFGSAGAVDWEDIALSSGLDGAPDVLVVADIGNNPGSGSRSSRPIRLYWIDEPTAPGAGATVSVGPAVSVDLAYADGPRDAETLLSDPLTGDLFIVSKEWDGTAAGVYLVPAAAASAASSSAVTMARVATVDGTEGDLVTGGDVSADGRAVVLRTYSDVFVWDRAPATSVAATLASAPTCTVPVSEPQGEAVAVLADGTGFVTISEGAGAEVLVRRDH